MAKRKQEDDTQGQPYDNVLKSLLEGQEAEILPHLVPGMPDLEYVETLNIEFLRRPLRGDRVYRARLPEHSVIVNLEMEIASKNAMQYRLLDYHAYLLRKYQEPIISVIVYPFPTKEAESPLVEKCGDEVLLTFHFRVLCLWKLKAADFLRKHIVSMYMYALLPTMQDADERSLKQAIDELIEHYQHDETVLARELKWFGIVLRRAETVSPEDKRRVQERLDMWDSLIEQDPKMKQMRAESKAEGLAEGEVQTSQRIILDLLEARFPQVAESVKENVKQIRDAKVLRKLATEIAIAPDEAAVRKALSSQKGW